MRLKNSLLTMAVLLSGMVSAQDFARKDSAVRRSFSFLKSSDAWLTGYNAAGIGVLPVERLSVGELFVAGQNGEFVNYNDSPDSYVWGAHVESFYRLNRKIVFYGDVSYTNFTGKNMAGSAFIRPDETPFNLVETTDENRGTKQLETYRLAGAVSADVSRRLTVGGKVDYTAANYAKRKDLRHKNSLLDMYVTAGVLWRMNAQLDGGVNYYYGRRTEGITFQIDGKTDKEYSTLVDYGAFFGSIESSGGTGYTQENRNRPLFDEHHGGSVQLKWRMNPKMSVFAEATYKSRNGYFGSKSEYSVMYSKHSADIGEWHTAFSLYERDNLHRIDMRMSVEKLENYQSVYREQRGEGGLTQIVYYDPLKTTERKRWKLNLAYAGNWGISDFGSMWTLDAGVDFASRRQTAWFYPNYRKQNLTYTRLYAKGERNVKSREAVFTWMVAGSFSFGTGEAKNDGTYDSSAAQQSLYKQDVYLYREYEYLTARQAGAEAGMTYSRPLSEANAMRGYASLKGGVNKAFGIEYSEGSHRWYMRLAVGCVF